VSFVGLLDNAAVAAQSPTETKAAVPAQAV
jgi:hypothetical protein